LGHSKTSIESIELLILSAEEYFATTFTNPDRDGCPSESELVSCIRAGEMPNDGLLHHLFSCSRCFVLYRTQNLEHSERAATIQLSNRAPILQRLKRLSWVPIFALLLLGVGIPSVSYLVRDRPRDAGPSGPIADQPSEPQQTAAIPAPEAAKAGSSKVEPAPKTVRRSPGTLLARNRLEIDLATAGVLRGVKEGDNTERSAQVRRSFVALAIKLPNQSAAGMYKLSLVDAYGKAVGPSRSVRSHGRSISASLDFRSVRAGRYRLVISHGREAPDYFPLEITNGPIESRP
jgi:hypothetical protein